MWEIILGLFLSLFGCGVGWAVYVEQEPGLRVMYVIIYVMIWMPTFYFGIVKDRMIDKKKIT